MSSYSATQIIKSTTGNPMAGSGSFLNIRIDGRYSLEVAKAIAKSEFEREAKLKNHEYIGFAIEKTERFVDYKNPLIVDNNNQAKDILFLL